MREISGEREVTLRDVAQAAGVSRSTVQRALANDPRTKRSTAERVRQVAKRLGYVPHPIYAALGSRQAYSRAKGLPWAYLHSRRGDGTQASGTLYLDEVRESARHLGYAVTPYVLSEFRSAAECIRVLEARGICGALISRVHAADVSRVPLGAAFPLVSCGRTYAMPIHTVRASIVAAIRLAWNRLRELGYTRIGCAIMRHNPPVEDDFSREASVRACLASVSPNQRISPLLTPIHEVEGFREWIERYRPDVVLSFRLGHYWDLLKLGIQVPEEVAFAALHLFGGIKYPSFTGLMAHRDELAGAAVNLLNDMVRRGERGVPTFPLQITVPSRWIDGETAPPVNP